MIVYIGNNRLDLCSWQAVVNTTSGSSNLKENQFTSKNTPNTLNLTFGFKFADVPSNIVLFPGSEDYVWLGLNILLITTTRKVINEFNLIDPSASSPLYCTNPNDLYVDTPNQIIYISCSTGVLALSVQNGAYYMETVGEGSAHAFVFHDGYTYSIYVDSNALWRFNLKNGDIVPIFPNVRTSVGFCSSKWQPLTFNTTYFFLKCKESNQVYLVREGQDKQLIPLNGDLWNLKDIVVDLTTSNFTFYKNDFQSKCSVSLPFAVSRVDSIDIDGKIILVFLTPSVIMVYNTSKGCNDQYLQVMANGTFPCFNGGCDGYRLFSGQYILVVSLHSGTYRIGVIDLKSFSPIDYHFNLVDSPQGLNAFCDPTPTSQPGESGSGYVSSIDNSTSRTSTLSPVPSSTSSVNITTTSSLSISTSSINSFLFSVGSFAIPSTMPSTTPSTKESPTTSNESSLLQISLPPSLFALLVLLVAVILICFCVRASWKNNRKQPKLSVEEIQEINTVTVVLHKLDDKKESGYNSLADDSYYTEGLPQNGPHDLIVVPGSLGPRLNNTDQSTFLSTNADQVQYAVPV